MLKFILLLCIVPLLLSGLFFDPDRSDVTDTSIASAVVSVGASAVEAKASTPLNTKRQFLFIYNDSNAVMYYGPSSVTTSGTTKGIPLYPKQFVSLPVGGVSIYLISATSSNNAIVEELE
jgi:hypothetical protein